MTSRSVCEEAALIVLVSLCWVSAVGMWRMKGPTQALHYASLPAASGTIFLTIAVFIAQGVQQASWKVLLIATVLFASNSVVTHATARAFRTRRLGHWEPREGESIESAGEEKKR